MTGILMPDVDKQAYIESFFDWVMNDPNAEWQMSPDFDNDGGPTIDNVLNLEAACVAAIERGELTEKDAPMSCPRCRSEWVEKKPPSLFGQEWYCKRCGLLWSPDTY